MLQLWQIIMMLLRYIVMLLLFQSLTLLLVCNLLLFFFQNQILILLSSLIVLLWRKSNIAIIARCNELSKDSLSNVVAFDGLVADFDCLLLQYYWIQWPNFAYFDGRILLSMIYRFWFWWYNAAYIYDWM